MIPARKTTMASEQARAVHLMLSDQRSAVAGAPTPLSLAEQRAMAEHIGDSTAEPTGVTFEDVDAGGVPAQWVTPDDAATNRALLYFHGGGYCYCSMRSHSRLVGHLAKAAGCRALNVDYRLAPEDPHPAALTDALAAYRWLLEQGVEPSHIVVAGDSAGGGIAAALLLKARDEGVSLPAAGVLMSPWVDLAMTADSVTSRADVDVRQDPAGTRWCAGQFLAGQDPRDPYASPLYADLTGLPPLYIQAGDWDTLVDDSHRLANKARRCGVDVRLDVFPEMLHAHQIWAGNMPEADDAVARIGEYVGERLALVSLAGNDPVPAPSGSDVYYDPYDVDIDADPYPVYQRLRAEAPLYYNERYDFFAVSRAEDVERVLTDHETFISGRGAFLDFIRAEIPMPPGMFIFEDPPTHTRHRKVVSRVFTPRRMAELEPQIRAHCARSLDPFVGSGRFDFVADLGAQVPMRTISMLLGIPESDQETVRDRTTGSMRTEPGQPMEIKEVGSPEMYAEYIDWRAEHPSDDLMTDMLRAEFEDETGTVRRLTREEILTYCGLIASAGNETAGRLIGWMGKVLADHPDQRRELVEDPSLIPAAVEEVLRFEPPGHNFARYVSRDVELHGTTVPEGSVMLYLIGAANRDERRFPDGERFDIHRMPSKTLTFGYGIHYCLGAALARLEGRVVLEEVLKRFPEWEIDMGNAQLTSASVVRGWETLPAFVS
jgi:cytochrome P450/acetyl esterase/lipase